MEAGTRSRDLLPELHKRTECRLHALSSDLVPRSNSGVERVLPLIGDVAPSAATR
jgi:hypothetical protein